MKRTLTQLACLAVAACTTHPTPSPAPAPTTESPARSTAPIDVPNAPASDVAPAPAWLAHHSLASNAGTYVLHVAPPPSSIPDNETFQLEVWIARADAPSELCVDVDLSVDAGMPEHGHGMNRVPKLTRTTDGHFVVEGMYFHMTGRWELYFDVTRGAVTERAQCDVVLADE